MLKNTKLSERQPKVIAKLKKNWTISNSEYQKITNYYMNCKRVKSINDFEQHI